MAKRSKAGVIDVIDANARRWHWRTWNMLHQIKEATDGEDARQRSGEMTERGLCISGGEAKAFAARGWVDTDRVGELFDDNGNSRVVPVWTITKAGRAALETAKTVGIQYL